MKPISREKKRMPARFEMQSDVTRRGRAKGFEKRDHLVRTAEARRLQAEAIAAAVHRVWTSARRALGRLINGKSRERRPGANGQDLPEARGRAGAAAPRRVGSRASGLLRRLVLEPYDRRSRRRIAIAQLRALDDRLLADIGLTRGQMERAVDGVLARRGELLLRPRGRGLPAGTARDELPIAA
jgi:uncharacterized protein YjiS (DUF1127 family)